MVSESLEQKTRMLLCSCLWSLLRALMRPSPIRLVLVTLVAAASGLPSAVADDAFRPKIAFLVVESTDGRTWSPGYQDDVIPLPNLRKLQAGGTRFERHYANTPVCCPSRATLWSGRHAHNLPHVSALSDDIVDDQ